MPPRAGALIGQRDVMENIHIGWPEAIYLALVFFALGVYAIKHGENHTTKWNFWAAVIHYCFMGWLLYWGGFFS